MSSTPNYLSSVPGPAPHNMASRSPNSRSLRDLTAPSLSPKPRDSGRRTRSASRVQKNPKPTKNQVVRSKQEINGNRTTGQAFAVHGSIGEETTYSINQTNYFFNTLDSRGHPWMQNGARGSPDEATHSDMSIEDIDHPDQNKDDMGPDALAYVNKAREHLGAIRRYQETARGDLDAIKKRWPVNKEVVEDIQNSLNVQRQWRHLIRKDFFIFFGNLVEPAGGQPNREAVRRLLEMLKTALEGSKAMVEKVQGFKSSSNLPRDARNSKLTLCTNAVKSAGLDLLNLYRALLNDYNTEESPRSLEPEEVQELGRLTACRHASIMLCRQLSKLCNEHETHKVYVNLEKIEQIEQTEQTEQETQHKIRFRLAFQRTDKKGTKSRDLVWIKAESIIGMGPEQQQQKHPNVVSNLLSVSSGREQDDDRVIFCPGSLAGCRDFSFRVGSNTRVQRYRVSKRSNRVSLSLSRWIKEKSKKYKDAHFRIRLARLISEAVLKFDPVLWCPARLKSYKIMLIQSESREETHLSVSLGQHEVFDGHQQRERQHQVGGTTAGASAHIRELLFNLGVILLELAYLEQIETPDRLDPDSERARIISTNFDKDKMENHMGARYGNAVQFCLQYNDNGGAGDIYNKQTQQNFYLRVIRELKSAEDVLGKWLK